MYKASTKESLSVPCVTGVFFFSVCLPPPPLFCCDRNYLYMLRPKFGFFSCQLGLQMSSQFSLVDPHDVKAPTSPACLLLFFLSTNTCFYIGSNDTKFFHSFHVPDFNNTLTSLLMINLINLKIK